MGDHKTNPPRYNPKQKIQRQATHDNILETKKTKMVKELQPHKSKTLGVPQPQDYLTSGVNEDNKMPRGTEKAIHDAKHGNFLPV